MSLQWLNMDMGLINSNEQRITTSRENSFFILIDYVYEVDVFLLNLLIIILMNGPNLAVTL